MTSLRRTLQRRRPKPYGDEYPVPSHDWWVFVALAVVVIGGVICL